MYSRYVSGRLGRTLLPIADDVVNLGHQTARFGSIYLTGNTIDLDGATISTDPSGQLNLSSPTGSIAVTANVATFLGAVELSPTSVLINSGNTLQRPSDAIDGTLFINLETEAVEFYANGAWVAGGGAGASVQAVSTVPVDAEVGDLWFDTDSGVLSVFYANAWVMATGLTGPVGPPGQNGAVGATGASGLVGATGPIATVIMNLDGGSPTSIYGGVSSINAGGVT